eukprot:2668077-Prymnesium_polylepis.1
MGPDQDPRDINFPTYSTLDTCYFGGSRSVPLPTPSRGDPLLLATACSDATLLTIVLPPTS